MRIVMSGANGFVGSHLRGYFTSLGYKIIALSRDELSNEDKLLEALHGCDVVINLAGASIAKRWSEEYKKTMLDSRINTTKALIHAFEKMKEKPSLFISTSAVGIYRADGKHNDEHYTYGDDFLANLAIAWEREALRANEFDIRTVIFRFGVVLGQNGGALSKMLPPFKLGLGGVLGEGSQAFPWIHVEDLKQAYNFVIEDETKEGVYNLVAPIPTTNRELTLFLGEVLKKPTFFSVPTFILKLRFGEGASILLDGQEVYPSRLMSEGFEFKFTYIKDALKDILI